jgi:hypothetical protein
LNPYTDKDHFWAIRGGGGNSWGIITSATYKTHPVPTHINVALAQYATNSTEAHREVLKRAFQALPAITDAGYTGYGTLGQPLGLIFIQPNGTNGTATEVTKLLTQVGEVQGVQSQQVGSFNLPSWLAYCNTFLSDPNIATNIIDPSRLLTADILSEKTDQLLDLISDFPDFGPGLNFIGKVDSRARDSTSVHEMWKQSRTVFSMSANWPDDAPESEKRRRKARAVEVSRRMEEIVGKNGGTYVNEANPYEPNWERTFWGNKYSRLQEVKKKVDPDSLFVCNRCVGGRVVYSP